MRSVGAPISIAGSHLGEARHVCAFFESREDEYRVTLPFIKTVSNAATRRSILLIRCDAPIVSSA